MFKIDNWGSDTSNAKGMMAGQRYYRYFNEENNDITASGLADGNYRLRLTMASGVPTLSWVAE